jgi:hypothetical protein
MPEFSVKEVRLPELHLPEIKRDDIVRSLSGVHLPEIDLARARRASIKLPAVTLSSSDVGRMLAAAAAVVRLVRPTPTRASWLSGPFGRRSRSALARIVQPKRRRSRWPIVLGGFLVVVLSAWAVLRRPAVRLRIDAAARDARARFDDLRNGDGHGGMEVHEQVAGAAGDAGPAPTVNEHPDDHRATATDTSGNPPFEVSGTPG